MLMGVQGTVQDAFSGQRATQIGSRGKERVHDPFCGFPEGSNWGCPVDDCLEEVRTLYVELPDLGIDRPLDHSLEKVGPRLCG
jgi:hypothetical protein